MPEHRLERTRAAYRTDVRETTSERVWPDVSSYNWPNGVTWTFYHTAVDRVQVWDGALIVRTEKDV